MTVLILTILAVDQPVPESRDCRVARHIVERSICADDSLRKVDMDLTTLFKELSRRATPRARSALAAAQRAWLKARNVNCRRGERTCLADAYTRRLRKLIALEAVSQDEILDQVTPVILEGRWLAGPVMDYGAQRLPKDTLQQLESDRLPAPGSMVRAGPALFCAGAIRCDNVGWKVMSLGDVEGGHQISAAFGFPLSTRALKGTNGTNLVDYTLVIRPQGTLVAVFGICDDAYRAEGCRSATQSWVPTSSDARVEVGN